MKFLRSRKVIAILAGILGAGGGAALDEKTLDLISARVLEYCGTTSAEPSPEVTLAPQCFVTVSVDENFLKNHCGRLYELPDKSLD